MCFQPSTQKPHHNWYLTVEANPIKSPLDSAQMKLHSCCSNKHPKPRQAFERVKTPCTSLHMPWEGGRKPSGEGLRLGWVCVSLQMEVAGAGGKNEPLESPVCAPKHNPGARLPLS